MRYGYRCDRTGEELILELPMTSKIPSSVERDGKIFYRIWNSTTIEIPDGFHDGRPFNYDKSPSGRKHYY